MLDSVDEIGKSDDDKVLNDVVDVVTAPEPITDENSEDDENVTIVKELAAAVEMSSFVKELEV